MVIKIVLIAGKEVYQLHILCENHCIVMYFTKCYNRQNVAVAKVVWKLKLLKFYFVYVFDPLPDGLEVLLSPCH